ncbi:MAG: DnaT-like ssDNA-binding protein [Pusillimonas sp.]
MALIVESGVGLDDAESYVSVADATTYAAKMGHSAWSAVSVTDTQREAALRQATAYIDSRYRFRGKRLTDTQALEWPRDGYAWPQKRVADACCELAVRALAGPLYADVDALVTEETIGPLTTKYAAGDGQVRFTQVDDMLRPLTAGVVSTIRLNRA